MGFHFNHISRWKVLHSYWSIGRILAIQRFRIFIIPRFILQLGSMNRMNGRLQLALMIEFKAFSFWDFSIRLRSILILWIILLFNVQAELELLLWATIFGEINLRNLWIILPDDGRFQWILELLNSWLTTKDKFVCITVSIKFCIFLIVWVTHQVLVLTHTFVLIVLFVKYALNTLLFLCQSILPLLGILPINHFNIRCIIDMLCSIRKSYINPFQLLFWIHYILELLI